MTFEEALHISSLRPSTPVDLLRAGRDLLSVPGVWVQNGGDMAHRCTVTSMWRTMFDVGLWTGEEREPTFWTNLAPEDDDAYKLAMDELRNTLEADGEVGHRTISVSGWNDREGRTVEEVLDLFDRTIARLEGVFVDA